MLWILAAPRPRYLVKPAGTEGGMFRSRELWRLGVLQMAHAFERETRVAERLPPLLQ